MLKQSSIAIITLSTCLLPISVLAQTSGVTTFGDSLSDNGNAFRATGGAAPPSPPYFNGRFSNGPVWIENVVSNFKLSTTSDNFAFGGATSGTFNTFNVALPGLTNQLDVFLQASPKVDPNRLFVVWAGANDYLGGGQTNPAITVGNLSTAVQRLTAAGATQIVVPNLPNLGKIPASLGNPAQSAGLTQLSTAHNSFLSASLRSLASNNPNISIVPTDLEALFSRVISNPARFGLTNATEPCLNSAAGTICATPDTYLFWDPLHPTAAGHQIIGAFAFDTLTAPQTIAPQVSSVLSSTRRQTGDINRRLLALRTTPVSGKHQLAAYITGDLNTGDRQNTSTTTGFNIDTKGGTVGVDYPVTDRLVIGLAATNSSSNNQLNDNKGKVGLSNTSVSIYGSYQQDKLYADALISYGWDSFDLTRRINVTGFDRATANPSGNRLTAGVSGGYEFGANGLSIGPIVGLRYTKVKINGYTEQNGDILNLKVNPQQTDSVLFNIGAQVAYSFRTNFGTLSPYISASYERELSNNNRQIVTELVTQPGIPMRTNVAADAPDSVLLSTGVQAQFTNSLSVALGYKRLFGNNANENNLNAQLRYQF